MSDNNIENESGDTFIIVTKPETGFLWDQLTQKERTESLKNIITKKLQNYCEEESIDILVQTIDQMYLKEYQTAQNPINYPYSLTKNNQENMLSKFKKILQETNWIVPIVFDRRKVASDSSKLPNLPADAMYSTDLKYSEKKIKEYHLNINSKLLRKLQNPYIAPRSLDAKVLDQKIGPLSFSTARKAVWYVNIPKEGKISYSEIVDPRIIVADDKVYLDGLILDLNLKNHYDFLKWYISPNVEVDYLTKHQPKLAEISNSRQKIYRVTKDGTASAAVAEERKNTLIKKTIDRYNLSALQDKYNPDPDRNNEKREVIQTTLQTRQTAEEKDLAESINPADTIYNVRKWPYFIVQFSDITELIGNYPLELSKYDSRAAYELWISKDTRVQHLVYLIEKILTDLDVNSVEDAKKKLQSIKAEFDKKQVISKGYCEKEKCPSTFDTLQQVLDNLTYLIDQYTYHHSKVKRNIVFKKMKRQITDQNTQKKLISDILEWGVKNVYGADIYNKVLAGEKLTDEQQKKVDQFVINITNRRKAYINNTCPHLPIRKKLDKTSNHDSKMKLLDTLLTGYAKDIDALIIECKLCGYPIGCHHEKLQLTNDKQSQEELETKFYASSYLDYLQNIISCRECGRKIKDVAIEVQVDYEKDSSTKDRSVRTGHNIFGHLERLAQSELTKILYYTQLRVLYPETPLKLYATIEPVIEDDLKEVEDRLKEKKRARERRQLIYINSAIIGKIIFDSIKKDFKERILTDFPPVKENADEMQKTIAEMQKHRNGDIKKYYVYHNQLVEQAIKYFIKLIKSKDKSFVTKLGLEEAKFDQIIHAYIKKYYQKFSERYRFGLNKTKNGMVKFIRRGKIYQIEDTQYQITLPSDIPDVEKYQKLIKKGESPKSLTETQGFLNYIGNKKWYWHHQHVQPGALLNSKQIEEFNKINTQSLEVRPGITSQIPSPLVHAIYNELWQYSSSKNKRRHQGKRIEIVFDLTKSSTGSRKGVLKYPDFNYLLYCPNGRPHLWIMKSSKPDESGRECYWCHMSRQEAKEKTQQMTDKDYQELQDNIQEQKIIEYFRSRCTDHTPHNFFNGYCLNCGENYKTVFDPDNARTKKLKDAWKNKPQNTASVTPDISIKGTSPTQDSTSGYIKDIRYSSIDRGVLQNFVATLIKNIAQLQPNKVKLDKFKSDHGKDISDKLFSKKIKNFKPIVETLTNDLLELGYFKRRYDDDIANAKDKISDKDELESEINTIKTKFRSEQVKELKSYTETFFQHISIILNNSRSYVVHDIADIDYLNQFIDAGSESGSGGGRDDFTKIHDYFRIENYQKIFNTLASDYTLKFKTKSNILHNILINDLLSKLLVTPFTSLFVFGFIDRILYTFAQIGDKTLEEREFIDLITEEKVLAKRLKFYKKLHEEKVEAGLAFADFEEQEAYFDAEKDTFQLEAPDAPDDQGDQDIQQEDDIINDIQLDDLDVDTDLFDGGVYEADYADRELVLYGNDL